MTISKNNETLIHMHGKKHRWVAECGNAPGTKQHTHISPWLHHPSFPVSEVHGLLSHWKRRNKRSPMVCGPPRIMFFYIFSWWGWGDKNRTSGSYSTKAKIWQCNYPKVLLKLKFCHFNCFKGNFQAWKFQICLGLWSVHGLTLAGIIIFVPWSGHHTVSLFAAALLTCSYNRVTQAAQLAMHDEAVCSLLLFWESSDWHLDLCLGSSVCVWQATGYSTSLFSPSL